MIVKCEQCSTRFKIPDDKVTDKGVKVRCSKCGHTFRFFKDGTIAAASTRSTGSTQVLPAAPAPADPFSAFGNANDPTDHEMTRPVAFTPGVEATKNPDLKPLEPTFNAQSDVPRQAFESPTAIRPLPQPPPGRAPLRTPPPAGGDFAALFEAAARQPVAPGGFDPFAGFEPNPPPPAPQPGQSDVTLPREVDPYSATQPRAKDPYAELFKASPVPNASDLFGGMSPPPPGPAAPPPPLPRSSPTQPNGASLGRAAKVETIPFAHSAPTQSEVPAWKPPTEIEAATVPTAQVPAYQPEQGHELPSADDFFANTAPPPPAKQVLPDLAEGMDGIEADEGAKHQLFDMPAPASAPSPVPEHDDGVAPLGRIALKKITADDLERARSGTSAEVPAAALDSSSPRRKVFSLVLNVTIATLLVAGVAIFGSIWLADGKLDRQSFSTERVMQLFKSSDLVAFDISNGLYDTRGGRPVFYVRGEVENRGKRASKVRVRAELVDGESLVRASEAYAGATPTPEQLWSVGQGEDLEQLSQKLSGAAAELKPGEHVAFLVPFYEYPRDLKTFRVRVRVLEASVPTASR